MENLGVHDDDHLGIVNADQESLVVSVRPTVDCDDDRIIALDTQTRDILDVEKGDTVAVEPISLDGAHHVTAAVLGGVPDDPVVRAELKRRLNGRAVREGWSFRIPLTTGTQDSVAISITDCPGSDLTVISRITDLEFVALSEVKSEDEASDTDKITYDDLGGVDDAISQVREVIERPLARPELYDHLGAESPSGVLLYGPPGTGKTRLAKAVANEIDAHFESIQGPEVFSKWFGESEANVREVFERAEQHSPAIVFIDELDAIAQSRSGRKRPEDRVVTQLLTLLDGLDEDANVIVVATTNRVDDIDRALRRPGRFDREIEVSSPDRAGRRDILRIHTRDVPLGAGVDIDDLARQTVGFTGADLAELVTEATRVTSRRAEDDADLSVDTAFSALRVTNVDFEQALERVEPSAMREYRVTLPDVGFDDVGGQTEAKHLLERAVVWPAQHAETFETFGLTPPSGVLLYGPPGTGKTRLATAVANAADATFLSVKGPELMGESVGETVGRIEELFERAQENAPCVVFFDEVDALATTRGSGSAAQDSIVGQLLAELDGAEANDDVFVLAATNRLDALDDALVRPGRFEHAVEVGLPDEAARAEILRIHSQDVPLASDVDLDEVAAVTVGFTGADLAAVCREATMRAVDARISSEIQDPEESQPKDVVTHDEFLASVDSVSPTVAESQGEQLGHHPSMFS
ncbi:hypothetical protein AUR66_18295 [Haloferax profundi]|uniref:AAA+ ATPase domain-containing protein n=2 Tax=Haloferax profundi TaxID=1544718 RepID=A0A0W1RXA3_9EURY|nr:hypothetical protein AUR66_18295 [Haloferax profundi]